MPTCCHSCLDPLLANEAPAQGLARWSQKPWALTRVVRDSCGGGEASRWPSLVGGGGPASAGIEWRGKQDTSPAVVLSPVLIAESGQKVLGGIFILKMIGLLGVLSPPVWWVNFIFI